MHTQPEQASDTHYEVALDEEQQEPADRKPVYVDVVSRVHELRPVVPASLRPANLPATVRRSAQRTAHRTAYHAVRLPRYVLLVAAYAVWGLLRLAGRQIRWAWVMEQNPLREESIRKLDVEQWLKLFAVLGPVRKRRLLILCAELPAVVCAVLALVWLAPTWAAYCVAAVCTLGLAWVGQPAGKPIVTPAVVTPRLRKLTADIVLRAYEVAGLSNPKKGQAISFASTMARDGEGSRVVIDLPYGKTYLDAVKAKGGIASGLDVTEYQVFLTRDKTSNRRHVLWVADRNPLAIPAGRTPLLDCRQRDVWTPMPFGLDERGRKVSIDLLWKSFLVGAQPRRGKTFAARLIALFAALDPYVKIDVVDGKNSPDWQAFKLVANSLTLGTHPTRDGDPIEDLLCLLREIKKDIQGRNDKLRGLPVEVCPEGKLTREISRDKRLAMPVRVLVMEEFQVYFETEDQDVNKEIAGLLSFIIAVGPSAGIILLSSSQKPAGVGAGDVARLFNRYRDNHGARFALRCGNRVVSEAVLGGDAYGEGYDASALPVGDEYRGLGILYGLSDDTPLVRTHLADAQDASKILAAARRWRVQAGTLTGLAAGEQTDIARRDPLDDVRRVFYAGEAWVSWQQIASRLAEQHPDTYAEITAEAISATIRALDVESVNGKQAGQVLRGAKLAAIEAAIAARQIRAG